MTSSWFLPLGIPPRGSGAGWRICHTVNPARRNSCLYSRKMSIIDVLFQPKLNILTNLNKTHKYKFHKNVLSRCRVVTDNYVLKHTVRLHLYWSILKSLNLRNYPIFLTIRKLFPNIHNWRTSNVSLLKLTIHLTLLCNIALPAGTDSKVFPKSMCGIYWNPFSAN